LYTINIGLHIDKFYFRVQGRTLKSTSFRDLFFFEGIFEGDLLFRVRNDFKCISTDNKRLKPVKKKSMYNQICKYVYIKSYM